MITPPQWLSAPQLGSYSQDHSFYINPIVLTWISESVTTVSLLNGALPQGMYWVQTGEKEISVFGEAANFTAAVSAQFTFRVVDSQGFIADQTFFISITPAVMSPSWDGQPSFLGYHVQGQTETYQLTATTTGTEPIVYSLISPAPGQSINSVTGVLTLDPSAAILVPAISTVTVNARTGTTSRSILVNYHTVRSYDPPYFITQPGEILVIAPGEYVEYVFDAYSPDRSNVTFTGGGIPHSYTLTHKGLLTGVAAATNQLQTFTVTISNVHGSRTQSQQILVSSANSYQIQFNNTNPDLGRWQMGQFLQLDLSATSTFSATIQYTITGGVLPANLTLTPNQGLLQGFLDYSHVPHEYRWQVTASDGVNTQTQEYYMDAYPVYSGQFVDFVLPVTGSLKLALEEQVVENYITTTDPVYPAMNIISGVRYNNRIGDLLAPARPWLSSQQFVLGNLQVSGSALWRNVYDHQQGEAATVTSVPGGTMWPQGLDNLRRVWSSLGYASDGYGTGAVLQPVVDLEIGSLADVTVVSPGSGYRYPPQINIQGTGNGAVLTCELGVVSAAVTNSTNAWSVGNTIVLQTGIYSSAAVLTVNSVNAANYITSVSVTYPGLYTQTPVSNHTYQDGNRSVTLQSDWGIAQVMVLDAGSGYSNSTTLDTLGQETLPLGQAVWSPQITQATIDTRYLPGKIDTLPGKVWTTNHLVLRTQGKSWQGATTYDSDNTSWDGGCCTFQDWIQPSYTTWDQNQTTWDTELTTWDHATFNQGTAEKFMMLDLDLMTWQQMYDILYMTDNAIYQSDTLVEWLVHMPTFVLSSQNTVYTGNIALA